ALRRRARALVGRFGWRTAARGLYRLDHRAHGQAVLAREMERPLAVARTRHDRARAVAHEDEVPGPDRDALAVEGVRGVPAGEDTLLLDLSGLAGAAVLRAQASDRPTP